VITAGTLSDVGTVVIVNPALIVVAGIVTVDGTNAGNPLVHRLTTIPPKGAGALRFT